MGRCRPRLQSDVEDGDGRRYAFPGPNGKVSGRAPTLCRHRIGQERRPSPVSPPLLVDVVVRRHGVGGDLWLTTWHRGRKVKSVRCHIRSPA